MERMVCYLLKYDQSRFIYLKSFLNRVSEAYGDKKYNQLPTIMWFAKEINENFLSFLPGLKNFGAEENLMHFVKVFFTIQNP
jgi:hypothetical protein